MKVKMKSYYSGGKKEYAPGDIANFDAEECARLIEVGGAEALPESEQAEEKTFEPKAPEPKKTV